MTRSKTSLRDISINIPLNCDDNRSEKWSLYEKVILI